MTGSVIFMGIFESLNKSRDTNRISAKSCWSWILYEPRKNQKYDSTLFERPKKYLFSEKKIPVMMGSSESFTNLKFRISEFFSQIIVWLLFQLANWEKNYIKWEKIVEKIRETFISYSSNRIRKTQNEHLNIVCQNLNS